MVVAVGLIYADAMDSRWKFVWVGSDGDKLSSNVFDFIAQVSIPIGLFLRAAP
jgi:hypothetical protein